MVGDDTNWPMGLVVAPAINRRTLSAAREPAGTHLDQFGGPPLLSPSFFAEEALIGRVAFLRDKRGLFGGKKVEGSFVKGMKVLGLEGAKTERDGCVGKGEKWKVAWLQFMGE